MYSIAQRFSVFLGLAVSLMLTQASHAQQSPDARTADLVQTGKLRVGLGVVAPHHSVKDPKTGELRGVVIEIGRALAARLGVAFTAVEYPSPTLVIEGVKTQAWDVGFTAIDAQIAAVEAFRAGDLEALALPRLAPLQWAATLSETRVLDGRFTAPTKPS